MTRHAPRIAEVRTVPKFANYARQLDPATPSAGNRGTLNDLRVSATAALTAGDALARWWVNLSGSGVGLHGGRFQYSFVNGLYQFQLAGLEWVKDVSVSGTMSWDYSQPGTVIAHVSVTGRGTEPGLLDISWNDRQPHAMATISGEIGKRKILATMYAP